MCSIQYVYIVCYVRNRTQDFSSATIKIENLLAKSVVVVPPPAAGTLTLTFSYLFSDVLLNSLLKDQTWSKGGFLHSLYLICEHSVSV